ncbi:hypothetical protein GGI35DRAFT_382617 [Trichoderma velutinum]
MRWQLTKRRRSDFLNPVAKMQPGLVSYVGSSEGPVRQARDVGRYDASYRGAFRRAAVGASELVRCLGALGALKFANVFPLWENRKGDKSRQAERGRCTATIYLLIASFTQAVCLSGAGGYAGAIKPDWHDSMTRKTQGKKKPSKGLRSILRSFLLSCCARGPTRPGGNVAAMPCKFAPLVGGFCAEPRAASHGYGTTVRRRWDMDSLKSYLQCAYVPELCRYLGLLLFSSFLKFSSFFFLLFLRTRRRRARPFLKSSSLSVSLRIWCVSQYSYRDAVGTSRPSLPRGLDKVPSNGCSHQARSSNNSSSPLRFSSGAIFRP